MKKCQNSRILPYSKQQIAKIILHPETYNIRNYEHYRPFDEESWLEDYGDQYIVKYCVKEQSENRIVLDRYPFAKSNMQITRTVFEMKDTDDGQVELSVKEHIAHGNLADRLLKVFQNHDENEGYYMDLITKIQKFCAKEE